MSFYTALTGLNSATAQLGVTSNNIANVGTTGFKRSRADFGDIFSTSPLQKSSSNIGQGVSLKQVSQEFSQGNVTTSGNSLDLAITGDGFFPLRSPDGLQEVYTRNGSFTLNDQNNVVNSAGQRLLAAAVDSSGKADLSKLSVLNIPSKTSGQAKETTKIQLGLNLPADSAVLDPKLFDRTNPSTYNKSTALTVYDSGGNGYLATIYYVKTQNASPASPQSKWQTYVYVGNSKVTPALMQAADKNGQNLYVNKYGDIKPESAVQDELVTGKTQMFSLDDLTDLRVSQPASVRGKTATLIDGSGSAVAAPTAPALATTTPGTTGASGVNEVQTVTFNALIAGQSVTVAGLTLSATGSMTADEVATAFSTATAGSNGTFSGTLTGWTAGTAATASVPFTSTTAKTDVAEMTITVAGSAANTADDGKIDGASVDGAKFTMTVDGSRAVEVTLDLASTAAMAPEKMAEQLTNAINNAFGDPSLVTAATKAVAEPTAPTLLTTQGGATQTEESAITFTDLVAGQSVAVAGKTLTATGALTAAEIAAAFSSDTAPANGTFSGTLTGWDVKAGYTTGSTLSFTSKTASTDVTDISVTVAGSDATEAVDDRRYGMTVKYDSANKQFLLYSGTTGDTSSVSVTAVDDKAALLGLQKIDEPISTEALRGKPSQPAVLNGNPITNNTSGTVSVNDLNKTFSFTVGGVKATVELPTGNSYTMKSLAAALQDAINTKNDPSTGKPIRGVQVSFDAGNNRLTFTSGATGDAASIKVIGSAEWGLDNLETARGSSSTWYAMKQFTEVVDGVIKPQFIDENGKQTALRDGYETLPAWSPIYLDKGELSFDLSGKTLSPRSNMMFETAFLDGGKGALTMQIDFTQSTQYSSPFAVLSQSQDGAPEGDLMGLDIGVDGLVSANYSNGSQQSLGKIVLANFSSPTGLRQVGDASYLASATSGAAKIGEGGSAGFGTIRAGATERANVDITQELVDLITAQRNFQANAKAIETSSTMTQAIINIRA